eukprot:825652-Pyramimonas_sp.AAC.1
MLGLTQSTHFIPPQRLLPDGGCDNRSYSELARAGVAAVEVDIEGNLLRAIYSPLPRDFPQSPGDAEHAAVALAMLRSLDPASNAYHYDCSALGQFVTWTGKALAGRTPQARYWRPAARSLGSSPIPAT